MRKPVLILVITFALGGLAGAMLTRWGIRSSREDWHREGSAPPPSIERVTARGRIEPAGGIIQLAASSPDVLKKLLVREGQVVTPQQELAILASRDLREIEAEAARVQLEEARERLKRTLAHLEAQQQEAEVRLRQLERQSEVDIRLQESKVAILERQSLSAETLMVRMRAARSYSQQELDQQELVRTQAEQELNSARAVLAKLKEAAAINAELARAQRDAAAAAIARAQAEVPLASLQKALDLAREKLSLAVLRAPVAGTIVKVLAREGEMVGPQPVFHLAAAGPMIVVAEVYETLVPEVRSWMRSGKPVLADVYLRLPGMRSPFRGTVTSVGNLVQKNSIFSADPRQELDRRVVEVHILLDKNHHEAAAEFINMHVDVTIYKPSGESTRSTASSGP
ncbi:MAG: HlyD family efflux transporter periplasmic adaptor subunit [Gemmataceae bacterium]|nr:HlyD family efflux transporter periplasmic adaptor subunit [Gemmataceae bacterium]